MERRLNLIKTEVSELEKRVFPRFPFSYLTFKVSAPGCEKVFEVSNISLTGMQLNLKDGGHTFRSNDEVSGDLKWRGASIPLSLQLKWVSGNCLGVSFGDEKAQLDSVKEFLSIKNLVVSMRPLHEEDLGLDLPSNLKYWLRADAPLEIFVWRHKDGELSKFHILMMGEMVEWEDGQGLRTGTVVNHRDVETPLSAEDEIMCQFEESPSEQKIQFARSIIQNLSDHYIPSEARNFLLRKLGL